MENYDKKDDPLVSVLVPTYNRQSYLPVALGSVVSQNYRNLEIFVIRDGGEDVSDIVESFSDPRIIFISRQENRGKAFSLNEALRQAAGKYIAYLDDDDLFYPHHIETLVGALEKKTDCRAAYSDLYRVCCRVESNGSRKVLSKIVDISRDFDRFLMLYFNHVLHVSLMHHRDLLEKTGPYNENLNVLIDWDLTRRLVFFTDFYHVPEITGEFFCSVDESDRISVQRRKNKEEYLRNTMTIRTSRPQKPWPKMKDLSIILVTNSLDEKTAEMIRSIWQETYYPYQLYLPLCQSELDKLDSEMPNLITVPVKAGAFENERIDEALSRCEGDFVVIVPKGLSIPKMWVEDSLYALINSPAAHEGFELENSTDKLQSILIKREDIKFARDNFSNLSVCESLKAGGISIRRVRPNEIPFQFDQLRIEAQSAGEKDDWAKAAEIYEYIAENHQNRLWMKSQAAKAYFKAGDFSNAAQTSCEVNRQRSTVEMLLLEAKTKRRVKEFDQAIKLLERAQQILDDPVVQRVAG